MQRNAIAKYASRRRLTITTWFEDQQTASRRGRPQFNAMVKALRAGKARGVVIHKIDRGARNLRDWAELGELIDSGIDVQFVHEDLNLESRGGRLTADIQAVIAADYVRNLREQVRKGIEGRLRQGLCPWMAPFGYLDTGSGKPKIPDPIRASTVRLAFRLYATGSYSLRSLGVELDRRGLGGDVGRLISVSQLARLLRNAFYVGTVRWRRTGEEFRGLHEPLISRDVFVRVQCLLDGKLAPRTQKHRYLFRRLFTCRLCARSAIGSRQKGRIYYRCHKCGGGAERHRRSYRSPPHPLLADPAARSSP